MRWIALALLATVACSSKGVPAQLVIHYDAGGDGSGDGGRDGGAGDGAFDEDANPDLGGPCVDDTQCNDHIACTYDSCDKKLGRCLDVPDDSQCQDGVYCNGMEKCVLLHGCEPGPVVSCDDGDECQTARCVEATKSCQYSPRDVDQDGDPDARCFPHHDCNDLDPNVSSLHAEVCANGVDDNCNGLVDEIPCVSPVGCTCAAAVPVGGSGSYALSTIGCNDTFATSCSVPNQMAAQNVVAAITVPPGPPIDLDVWVTASTEVAVAIQGACGDSTSEIACGSSSTTQVRARAYGVGPGTYYAVVTTQEPVADILLQVDFLPNDPPPSNVDCASAAPITPGTPITVSIVEPLPTNEPTQCTTVTGELTYAFTLTQPQNVRVYASTSRGTGTPYVGLRAPHCTDAADELGCEAAGKIGLFQEDLQPGTYVVTLGADSPIDATLDVELSPATLPGPNQTCAAPPAIMPNGLISFDLSNNESAIKDGCYSQGPDAAYDLSLAAASDVLLIERIPQTETGGVSLDGPACDKASNLACDAEGTPVRVGKRNVPAGDYRVVVADTLGLQGTVEALVRDTVAPTYVIGSFGEGTCATPVDASSGGYFTGDTSYATKTITSGCDSPSSPPGGEQAQVLKLTLAQDQRVVLDMEGSGYQTILDVRMGPACPGSPTVNGCYVGFSTQRSFLDMELTAGPYFIVVSGFNGAKGAWALDVRILPP